jgi:diguanylate cyclase (GGDEF)-like protein/PAS domain S-box-containing protein
MRLVPIRQFSSAAELAQIEVSLETAQADRKLALFVDLAWQLRQVDCGRARDLCAQARQLILTSTNDSLAQQHLARLCLVEGEVALLHGDADRARAWCDEGRAGFERCGDALGSGDAEWLNASIFSEQGRQAELDQAMARAVESYRRTDDAMRLKAAQARSWTLAAFVDAQAAARGMAEELGPCEDCSDGVRAWVESAQATIAALMNRLGDSIKHDLQAHMLCERSGQVRQAMISASNASEGFVTLGDLDAALEWSERALSTARASGWPALIAVCQRQTGDVLRLLDRPEQAAELLSLAVATMQTLGASRNKGEVLHSQGRLELENECFDAALAIFEQMECDAQQCNHPDLLIKARRGQAGALSGLGHAERAALRALEALELARTRGNADDQIRTLLVLAEIHQHHALPDPAGMQEATATLHYLLAAHELAESVSDYRAPIDLLRRIASAYADGDDHVAAYRYVVAAEEARNASTLKDGQNRALALEIRRAVEQARSESERHRKLAARLQATADTLEILGRIGREITASLDIPTICRILHRHLAELMDVTFFLIHVLDADGKTLSSPLVTERAEPMPPQNIPLSNRISLAAACARERREIIIERELAEASTSHLPGTLPCLSLMFFPLEVGGRLLGVMSVQSTRANVYGERERAIFRTLCAWGAIGLDNATTYNAVAEQKQELRVAAVAFESQEAMLVADAQHNILRVNSACCRITGYRADELIGRRPDVFQFRRPDGSVDASRIATLEVGEEWSGELEVLCKDGTPVALWLSITAVRSQQDEVTHYVYAASDNTERKRAEEEIRSLAFYDPLTQLPNRRLLMDRLTHALATSERTGDEGALLFIDLDKFKTLNDTRGHDVGDLHLMQVARRLEECLRECDTVARWGGDEFTVLLEGLGGDADEAAQRAGMVARKILARLNEPYQLQRQEHHSSPSIGVVMFRGQAQPADELLKQADLAMYQAKGSGRNTVSVYDPSMQATVTRHARLEADLRQGLQNGQFLLYYQPQVGIDGQLLGAEALVRWNHPERGIVPPGEFISVAEDSGLILPLGRWILRTACAQLRTWSARPATASLSLAVNISARQFYDAQFVEQTLELLEETGIDPRRLKLELTESLLIKNLDGIVDKMHILMQRGIRFALDDFGTGYSSLSYLKRLPLEQLKIDRSFVRDLFNDENDIAIARAIVTLGQSLGMQVIAEGVEEERQWRFLESIGCQAFQGYFFGRPAPIAEFESAWTARTRKEIPICA